MVIVVVVVVVFVIVVPVANTVAARVLVVPQGVFAVASTEGGTRLVWRFTSDSLGRQKRQRRIGRTSTMEAFLGIIINTTNASFALGQLQIPRSNQIELTVHYR